MEKKKSNRLKERQGEVFEGASSRERIRIRASARSSTRRKRGTALRNSVLGISATKLNACTRQGFGPFWRQMGENSRRRGGVRCREVGDNLKGTALVGRATAGSDRSLEREWCGERAWKGGFRNRRRKGYDWGNITQTKVNRAKFSTQKKPNHT